MRDDDDDDDDDDDVTGAEAGGGALESDTVRDAVLAACTPGEAAPARESPSATAASSAAKALVAEGCAEWAARWNASISTTGMS